jgi:7-cyano-7-deazaguanine synthase
MKPLVLLSGGLDSAVVLERVRSRNPVAVTFDYGQPHREEIDAAGRLCGDKIKHLIVNVSDIWKHSTDGLFGDDDTRAASTVVPGRNLVFLSIGLALAAQHGCDTVLIGCNLDDYNAYPDCRPAFLGMLSDASTAGGGMAQIMAPLIRMTKRQVVSEACRKGIDIDATISCYRGTNCGKCSACIARSEAGA